LTAFAFPHRLPKPYAAPFFESDLWPSALRR
jgi:hypothetical protein